MTKTPNTAGLLVDQDGDPQMTILRKLSPTGNLLVQFYFENGQPKYDKYIEMDKTQFKQLFPRVYDRFFTQKDSLSD